MRRDDFLDAAGRQPVAGDIDDVVGAGHHVDIAVLVDEPGVGSLVIAGIGAEIGLHKTPVLPPQRRQCAGRQRQLDRQRADLAGLRFARLADRVGLQHPHVPARHRLRARAVLDRQALDAEAVGADRPAGLGLPPMVDDRDPKHLLGPGDGRRIGALAGQEQRTELRPVIGADQLALRVLALDRTERGRRREKDAHFVLLDDPPEGAASGVPTGLPSYMTEVTPWSSGP